MPNLVTLTKPEELRGALRDNVAFRVEYLAGLSQIATEVYEPVSDALIKWLYERTEEAICPKAAATKQEYEKLQEALGANRGFRCRWVACVVKLAREYNTPLSDFLIQTLYDWGGGGGGKPLLP